MDKSRTLPAIEVKLRVSIRHTIIQNWILICMGY